MNGSRRTYMHERWAESLAATYLFCKGYRILRRRYRTASGEIDLIVRRGKVLAFVEVKYRLTQEEALYSISSAQQQRITRTAACFLAAYPRYAHLVCRMDVVIVSPQHLPKHLVDAWHG
ncbi:MAG: YraN family protein [Anaerolineae bacterium]|nr:YraN family protein [Anaerolineae bacterium]